MGAGGAGGGRSERQMTNEQRRMNNDLDCWGRTGGSHRRAGRARYKARQGGGFFFFFSLPLARSLSQRCAATWTDGRWKEGLVFPIPACLCVNRSCTCCVLFPRVSKSDPHQTKVTSQVGKMVENKTISSSKLEWLNPVIQSELVPLGRSVQRVFKTIRRSGLFLRL